MEFLLCCVLFLVFCFAHHISISSLLEFIQFQIIHQLSDFSFCLFLQISVIYDNFSLHFTIFYICLHNSRNAQQKFVVLYFKWLIQDNSTLFKMTISKPLQPVSCIRRYNDGCLVHIATFVVSYQNFLHYYYVRRE